MVEEMESYSGVTAKLALEWADHKEMQFTEELDALLRAHRPRAGLVEEAIRMARYSQPATHHHLARHPSIDPLYHIAQSAVLSYDEISLHYASCTVAHCMRT